MLLAIDFLSDVVSNDIELLLSVSGDSSAELLWGILLISVYNTELFKLLKGVSEDLSSSFSMLWLSGTVSLLTTEKVLKSSNTDVGSKVNFSGDSSYVDVKLGLDGCYITNSGVDPIRVFWGEFLEDTSLDEFEPLIILNTTGKIQYSLQLGSQLYRSSSRSQRRP